MADELRPFFCLDLSYAHTLLTKGFKIPDDAQITLVRTLLAICFGLVAGAVLRCVGVALALLTKGF